MLMEEGVHVYFLEELFFFESVFPPDDVVHGFDFQHDVDFALEAVVDGVETLLDGLGGHREHLLQGANEALDLFQKKFHFLSQPPHSVHSFADLPLHVQQILVFFGPV